MVRDQQCHFVRRAEQRRAHSFAHQSEAGVAIVLGSGLGGFADEFSEQCDSLRRDSGFCPLPRGRSCRRLVIGMVDRVP